MTKKLNTNSFSRRTIIKSAAAATGLAAIALGAKGPSSAVATACADGSNAIGDAFRLLQLGKD